MNFENEILLKVETAVDRLERHLDRLEQRLAKLESVDRQTRKLDADYPEPTETWRDVTAECEVNDHLLNHNGLCISHDYGLLHGYRLRKVQPGLEDTKIRDAFIVERREP